jgi:heme exporter protein B
LIRQIGAVVRKELLIEWRSRSRASGVFFFALALLLLVAIAAPEAESMRRQVGGALWVGLLLASTRSLDQSFLAETEQGAMEGMVLWPVDARAIYYGKALGNTIVLLLVALALCPLAIALYDAPIKGSVPMFLATLVAGCAALAAPGTLYALVTSQARGASILLPVLLFPLVVPAVIAASRGTALAVDGDPMGQGTSWLGLLIAFDAIHWSLSGILFERIVEDA